MLRQRLFNIALLQLCILGMRINSSAYFALGIIQRQMDGSDSAQPEEIGSALIDHDKDVTDLWNLSYALLDHVVIFAAILCLLFGTKDENETPTAYKCFLLRCWMLISVIYNWGFCIATALVVDWTFWTIDEYNIGQFIFVFLNMTIFLFVVTYVKKIDEGIGGESVRCNFNGGGSGDQLNRVLVKQS